MFRNSDLFWGGVLILLGGLFFLQASGVITNVMGWFWALFLIFLGVWLILGRLFPAKAPHSEETFRVSLEGAQQGSVRFSHGAGRIEIGAGASPGYLLEGTAEGGISYSSHRREDTMEVSVSAGPSFVPFLGPSSGVWRFRLTDEVPLTLTVEMGASRSTIDIEDLNVTYLHLETGASSTKLILPAHTSNTLVDIDAGAANLDVRVPPDVAARIRIEEGLAALEIDTSRFPRRERGLYQSENFDTAPHKVEMAIDAGAAKVTIR
ncbi:MAG: hypothetical protein D6770_00465 [Anaerolineae bacterium]|nr:MAG: hypothetical protein D6770_00465 [Anaerolineae bacterium]